MGSSIVTKYVTVDGKPALMREPKVFFIDDKDGKAIGINLFIGQTPQIAFGNSDGDREMLEWTTAAPGARRGLLRRSMTTPPASSPTAPPTACPTAASATSARISSTKPSAKGWTVISMKNDWKRIYPSD